ncbi:uncharacterized protein LOC124927567 [Impatiens glandulifera]|uniref:uncharacterized protein LOC124927567 n=1 Tax=Impatiens glandulifera TaxID=253017 RepID=UPI001FB0EA99|nr:uncharacterized protein LOC124927567 [Impatiens glandulifera]
MQTLFNRTPPVLILCTAARSPFSSFPSNSSRSLGFCITRKTPQFNFLCDSSPSQLNMFGAATLHLPPSGVSSLMTPATTSFSNNPTTAICRCLINNPGPVRAWASTKKLQLGLRFHTVSDDILSVSATVTCNTSENLEDSIENRRVDDINGEDGLDDDKVVKLQRRQKYSSSEMILPGNPDLLTIPGVGPRNLRKLVDSGIVGVTELKALYKNKFSGEGNEKMVEFLQSSVGIIHKNHAESITSFIKSSVDEEFKEDNSEVSKHTAPGKRITFCVEGNIGVGKTTFLQRIANETIELRDLVEIVPEPVNKWQDIGPDHFNILDAFYAEPQRYAYTFQNYVFVTRVMQEKESSSGVKPLRLMERSIFSDRMVFVRAVHEAKWMNEMEISIYDSWFDPVISSLPGLIPDGFIYLRASPDTCHKRMLVRNREEECGVSLDYLRGLHEKHENWLFPIQSGDHGVLTVNKIPHLTDRPELRDRIFYLEGDHMHPRIQKVPALVLDCEPNIDFSRDIEAKEEFARQVATFFEFVKQKKEDEAQNAIAKDNQSRSKMILPQKNGLWVPPEGKRFPESALKSLDFRRAMSILSG